MWRPCVSAVQYLLQSKCSLATVRYNYLADSLLLHAARHIYSTASRCEIKLAENVEKLEPVESATEILANLSPEDSKRLKVLRLEHDVLMSTGVRVPDKLTDDEWLHIFRKCQTLSSRKRFYSYLFKNEKLVERSKIRTEERRKIHAEKLEKLAKMHQDGTYESKNTMLLFTREQTMNMWYSNNMCYSLMNGPHLVFDFAFENRMTDLEITDLIRQMQISHGCNKVAREPFHFHFCNYAPDGRLATKLPGAIGNINQLPISITADHYTSCYPASQLVYLSPNAPTVMTKFNPDDVYIVGAIVDLANEEPVTLAKAKKEKIRTVRFPLDHHVKWVQGSKSLSINHVVSILLELKKTNDWKQTLLNTLPKRKYAS